MLGFKLHGSVWYLDSGASFHMMGDKDLFSDLEEKDLQMHIEMGDDGRYSETSIGTINFEREFGNPFVEGCYACSRSEEELGLGHNAGRKRL